MVKRRGAADAVDKHVGSRVRMRRMMLGMSQEKLADRLGVTFQQVQKYEKGRNRIGAGRLQHISHILHIPVAFLFDGSPNGEAPLPPYVSDFLTTAEGLTLVEAFMRIENPALRRRIVELIEHVAATT